MKQKVCVYMGGCLLPEADLSRVRSDSDWLLISGVGVCTTGLA